VLMSSWASPPDNRAGDESVLKRSISAGWLRRRTTMPPEGRLATSELPALGDPRAGRHNRSEQLTMESLDQSPNPELGMRPSKPGRRRATLPPMTVPETDHLPALRSRSSPTHRAEEELDESAQLAAARNSISDDRSKSVFRKLSQKKSVQSAVHCLVQQLFKTKLSWKEIFNKLDANGDGSLSKLEMQTGLRKLGVSLLPVELDAVLRAFDADGNGTIEFSEFSELLAAHWEEVARQEIPEVVETICGFQLGARVQILALLPGAGVDGGEEGTVVGEGLTEGTVRVRFERTGHAMNLKPGLLALSNRRTVQRSKSFASTSRRGTL